MTSQPLESTRVNILGSPLDIAGRDDIFDQVHGFLSIADGQCRHLVTLNPEYVMLARRDELFRSRLWSAWSVVADGIGVAIAARLLHGVVPERVTGVDLAERLVAHGELWTSPVFLLGAGDGVADRAASRLEERYSHAHLAGQLGGSLAGDDERALAAIEQAGARVVLVAFGAERQVDWIERNRDALGRIGVRLALGVGGAFDFLAGDVPRAPALVQALGLEWLYRLIREPWRWRRQRVLPVFAWLVLRQWFRGR